MPRVVRGRGVANAARRTGPSASTRLGSADRWPPRVGVLTQAASRRPGEAAARAEPPLVASEPRPLGGAGSGTASRRRSHIVMGPSSAAMRASVRMVGLSAAVLQVSAHGRVGASWSGRKTMPGGV